MTEKLLDYLLKNSDNANEQFRKLVLVLVISSLGAILLTILRLSIVGLNAGAIPVLFGSFILTFLLIGVKNGVSFKPIAWFFGASILFIIASFAAISKGVEGPSMHLMILALFYFPYFFNKNIGRRMNLFILALTILVEWISLDATVEIMLVEDERIAWLARTFFMVRLIIFAVFANVLIPHKEVKSTNIAFGFFLWASWLVTIAIWPDSILWSQCLIYPIVFLVIPALDWEFQVMFLSANFTAGFLYTIHVNPDWIPGVASNPSEILPNLVGLLGAMLIIIVLQVLQGSKIGLETVILQESQEDPR